MWLRTGFQRFGSMLGDVDREPGTGGLTSYARLRTLKMRTSMAIHCALRARMFTGCLRITSKRRLLRSRIPAASSTVLLLPAGNTAIYEFGPIPISYFFFLLNSVATLYVVPTEHKVSHVRLGFYLGIGAPMSGSLAIKVGRATISQRRRGRTEVSKTPTDAT